ncbi:MAG: diguanylate cyclase [Alteromonadaceae bacterium]|nr:diguanylate cyclase [Alteromonadaceae bacterium]
MAKTNETIHLLILDSSQNDAEGLVSLLRNAGRATRAHRITSEADLLEALSHGSWELMLLRDGQSEEMSVDQVLGQVKRLDKDIPAIILTEEFNRERTVELMSLGARDAVPFLFQDLLLLTIKRELSALEERRRRRLLDAHLRESEQRCQLLLESSKDPIAYINDGMHIFANQSYLDFLGYEDVDEIMCIPVLDTLASDSQDQLKEFMRHFSDPTAPPRSLDCTARRSDDNELEVVLQGSPATYDGELCTQILLRPKNNDAELAEKLKQISSQDILTGLFNRHYLMDQLVACIARVLESGQAGALAYIAVDNFVQTKGQVGIAGTDLMLGDLANILRQHAGEEMTLARLSDDAFSLLCQPCSQERMLEVCERVRQSIADHLFDVSGRTVQMTVSIGIAPVTDNAPKAQDLMGRAHNASAEVRKLEGHADGNGILVYNPITQEALGAEDTVETIQYALDNDQFRLLFQPIINLRGDGEEHYESFLRMLDKNQNEVSPYDFLPPGGPAEMAAKIDRWVVSQTIKHLSSHRSQGHDTRLFLNITAETIQDRTFVSWLSTALKDARLPGDSLIFQIAETDAGAYLKQVREFTKALSELHCKLSISHFGNALNPFNTLKHVAADYVKLDGSFTEEIQKSDDAKERVKEMVQALQNMGKLTVVPLVENATVLSTLWQAGVNYIQGYYLQAPVPEMNYDFGEGD